MRDRGRSSFVAEDVTAEVRWGSMRGICVVENRRDSGKAMLAQKLKNPKDRAHAYDRSLVDDGGDDRSARIGCAGWTHGA